MQSRAALPALLGLLVMTACQPDTVSGPGEISSIPTAELPDQAAASTSYFPPSESSGGWRRLVAANSTPTSQQKTNIRSTAGLNWDILKQAWDASSQYGGAFLVIRNGWVAAEWGTMSAMGVASCTKTFTSLAIHRMFDMSAKGQLAKAIGSEDLAYRYMPASWGSHSTRKTIRMRHLLTMSSGLQLDDNPPSPNGSTATYEKKLLAPPVRTTPGKEWSYSSLPVDVMSLIATNITGLKLGDFFQRNIGSAIGINTLKWAALGNYSYGSAYSMVTGRDMARIAYLLLHKGSWAGKSVVSIPKVDTMTRWAATTLASSKYGPQVKFPTDPNSHKRYGLLTWTNHTRSSYVGSGVPADAFYCAGFRTNFAMVVPSLKLIIVRLQNGPEPWSDAVFTKITSKVMSAIVSGGSSTSASARLVDPASELRVPVYGTLIQD